MVRMWNPFARRSRQAPDIVVTFNEVDYEQKREYAPRMLNGEPFGFVDQLCALGYSAQQHSPASKRYAVHTQPLPEESAQRLQRNGWTVIRRQRAEGPPALERFHDRIAGFGVGTAEAQLYLDSDMIFTQPITFDTTTPIAAGYAGGSVFSHETWTSLCTIAGIDQVSADDLAEPAFIRYFDTGETSTMPFFNNGAVLLRRDFTDEYVSRMTELKDTIVDAGMVESVPKLGHFFDQVCMSLTVLSTPGASVLPPGVNAIRSRLDLTRPEVRARISLLHYLGGADMKDVYDHFPGPFDLVREVGTGLV